MRYVFVQVCMDKPARSLSSVSLPVKETVPKGNF